MVDVSKLTPAGLKAYKQMLENEKNMCSEERRREIIDKNIDKVSFRGWSWGNTSDELTHRLCRQGARTLLAEIRKDATLYLHPKKGRWIVSFDLDEIELTQKPLVDLLKWLVDPSIWDQCDFKALVQLSKVLKETAAGLDKICDV